MALIGNLKDIKLPSLIQLNCMERNDAKLSIERNGKYGFVYFESGQVTHAEYDPYIAEEAIYKLLVLNEGKFKVENGVKPPARTINTNWSNLLLEGMHKLDHAQDEVENRYYRMFERLLTIKGVLVVYLVNKSGICVDKTDAKVIGRKEPNSAFIFLQAQRAGKVLNTGDIKAITIFNGHHKYIIKPYNEHYLLIQMGKKSKSDVVLPLIEKAIGNKN